MFKHLSQQRALNKEEKVKAAKLLEMKANKKLVSATATMPQDWKYSVIERSVKHIATANKQRKSRNNLDTTVATFMDKYMVCSAPHAVLIVHLIWE